MNESERAVMESARFAAMESYFEARPQIAITRKLECIFEAGFDAAYAEVRRLRECLDKANTSAEHFEREWYLRGDEIDRVRAVLTSAQIDCKQWERHYKELREENERLRKDAERYRWLIDQHWIQSEVDWRLIPTHQESTIEQLSKAIDAARGAK